MARHSKTPAEHSVKGQRTLETLAAPGEWIKSNGYKSLAGTLLSLFTDQIPGTSGSVRESPEINQNKETQQEVKLTTSAYEERRLEIKQRFFDLLFRGFAIFLFLRIEKKTSPSLRANRLSNAYSPYIGDEYLQKSLKLMYFDNSLLNYIYYFAWDP